MAENEPQRDSHDGDHDDDEEATEAQQGPPEAWRPAQMAAKALVQPVERFLHIQAASGLLLLVAAVVAMAWANSPWKESYHHLWHTEIGLSLGGLHLAKSLHFWINDGLMVIFFFVVGLEIRREMYKGELSQIKQAALPIAAAVGGMIVPAGIFVALNAGKPEVLQGWGTPMATDIAFAVGILALLGKRVPAALTILLLALAVIDDIGAILVIALFYSSGVKLVGLAIAAGGMLGIALFQRIGIRQPVLYVFPSLVVWAGMYHAGVHPTIAGVIIGLMTPVRPWFGQEGFLKEASRAIQDFRKRRDVHGMFHSLERLDRARKEALSPVERLEHALNPWVAFVIMPLFALANAGVTLGEVDLSGASAFTVGAGIAVGLAVGKPAGIVGVSLLAQRLGIATLPRGVNWKGLLVVGCMGGIGFTMALFIANLAFTDPVNLGVAKLAVLGGSLVAGVVGLAVGVLTLPKELPQDIAQTPSEAESSAKL